MRDVVTRPTTFFASHYVDVRAVGASETIAAQLRESGLVTVDGLTSREAVLSVASRLMAITPHPHSAPDGLTPSVTPTCTPTARGSPAWAGVNWRRTLSAPASLSLRVSCSSCV